MKLVFIFLFVVLIFISKRAIDIKVRFNTNWTVAFYWAAQFWINP